jgi:LPXTG-motif cell wall-anchored protein
MNRFKVLAAILFFGFLGLAALAFSPGVKADQWDKETIVTFDQAVEIPGHITLPAGTYVFKLMDSQSNRHIVQIFSRDRSRLYATILAIPNQRLRVTERTVITFGERGAGLPEAIRAWFYPGDNYGQEFVYPKKRAVELARIVDLPILAMPTELESLLIKPIRSVSEEPVLALKEAPLTAVKPTGEEVEIAQVVELPPAEVAVAAVHIPKRLPQTASRVPLLALIGLASLGAGFALWILAKRDA